MRRLARICLTLGLLASLALAGWNMHQIADNPIGRTMVERTGEELSAAIERTTARHATPDRVERRLEELLADEPRNWIAVSAVRDLAEERGIPLPDAVLDRISALHDEDHGLVSRTGNCLACAYDPAACALSLVLMCQAPMIVTPLGDVTSIAREGGNYLMGREVDRLDLGFSIVGLTAVLLTPTTGGSSYLVGMGARIGKLAGRMGLISPPLRRMLVDGLHRAVDWGAIARSRGRDDIAAAVNRQAIAPFVETLDQLGRTRRGLGTTETLHVLRHVDTPQDARLIANTAEAMGPRMIGPLEVMGKSRFLRITMRVADQVWYAVAGVIGFAAALGGIASSWLSQSLMRRARRLARDRPGTGAPDHLVAQGKALRSS